MRRMAQRPIEPGRAPCGSIAARWSKGDNGIRLAQAGGCFIKGTRVYTKDGKKPIEEITVGDWVLSSPEDGSGQPEYKRVVRTFAHDPQPIFKITIHPEGWVFPDHSYFVVATGNHPFWVEGVGWTRADALKPQQWLRQGDGGRAFVGGVSRIYRTGEGGIGWIPSGNDPKGRGVVFDYANYAAVDDSVKEKLRYLPNEVLASDDPYLRVPVFNFEVEDFHTYYVGGKHGFWVRSANCEGPEGAREGEGLKQTLIELGKVPGATTKQPDANNEIRSQAGEGFIKGTRVHTKEGLKPIEEIKVGDWVLSSPEDGSGSPEYKRVVRTFAHDPQLVFNISIIPRWVFPDPGYFVVATGNHLFWVEDIGWTRTDALKLHQWLRQGNGGRAYVGSVSRVYRTGQEGLGWISNMQGPGGEGSVFDYANYAAVDDSVEDEFCYLPNEVLASDDPYLRLPVFNLEVEDFYTYYVGGKHGFWVRSANCEGPGGAREGEGLKQTLIEPGKVPGATAKPPDANNGIRSQAGEGFIKGTRVHTKEGLKPIEEIKVGDWVLSSPEDGSGSPEYKRVVTTFVHEDETIVDVHITLLDWSMSDPIYFAAAAENHPFWVEGMGWTRADALKAGGVLRKADGSLAKVFGLNRVYRTNREGVGWTFGGGDIKNRALFWRQLGYDTYEEYFVAEVTGSLFDYANYTPINTEKPAHLAPEVIESADPYLRVAVYNLDVEDFHTYYVGAKGFWVHSVNFQGGTLAKDIRNEAEPG